MVDCGILVGLTRMLSPVLCCGCRIGGDHMVSGVVRVGGGCWVVRWGLSLWCILGRVQVLLCL